MCLFYVECHARCVVTDLVVRSGNTNSKQIGMEIEACRPYHWMTEKACSYSQREVEGRKGLRAYSQKDAYDHAL